MTFKPHIQTGSPPPPPPRSLHASQVGYESYALLCVSYDRMRIFSSDIRFSNQALGTGAVVPLRAVNILLSQ